MNAVRGYRLIRSIRRIRFFPRGPPMKFVDLRLQDIQQLFNSMDPSPFREKDLDRDAEEFIVSRARELPGREPLTLRVHLEHPPERRTPTAIAEAVRNHFAHRAELGRREFRQLMHQGRLSLLIGTAFLAACITASELATRASAVWSQYLSESLTIAGWVAMWRPMQIYLYDWWPILRHNRRLERLSGMQIEILQHRPSAQVQAQPPA
jgi:hypothetical protein